MRLVKIAIIIYFFQLIFVFANEASTIGENATISGFVFDIQTKETLVGATVFLEGTKIGALTNKTGFFALNNVPPGKYRIVVTYVGYERFTDTITLKKERGTSPKFLFKTKRNYNIGN